MTRKSIQKEGALQNNLNITIACCVKS